MATNISLTSVVHLIFNQCKQSTSTSANTEKIIEYIKNNFEYSKEEANQLQFNELFESLKYEGSNKNDLVTEEDFERIFKQWIPLVGGNTDLSNNEEKSFDDTLIFSNTEQRLSRSLTNLKQQTDRYQKRNYYDNWCDWDCNSPTNIENIYNKSLETERHMSMGIERISPHVDPFDIPLDAIKSTPARKRRIRSRNVGILQQPDLRYIKQYRGLEQTSYSDTETISRYESSLFEGTSIDSLDGDRFRYSLKRRHRSSYFGGESVRDLDSRDLLSQLRQIKFKNTQLVEINERLQSQLELAEENIRSLNSKYMDLEKKNRHYVDINNENQQLILEIDDIRKCVESEMELKRRIQSEKVMTEGELTAAKEHIQSLIDRLSVLDGKLIEKDRIILNLKAMITQQEEFCLKLQEMNAAKDEELIKNQKGIKDLTDAICEYEEKIQIISTERFELDQNSGIIRNDEHFPLQDIDQTNETEYNDIACGGKNDLTPTCTTQSEFRVDNLDKSLWSIKLELAKELIESPGDSPLCEKLHIEEDLFDDFSDNSSFQMLNGLLSIITSLRMTLAQYREQLETASRCINNSEHFSDEISLSYISYLNDAINLLNVSTEKASKCQQQFNDTFNLLMKRISMLRNNNKILNLRNEKLLSQIQECSNTQTDTAKIEKLSFLEEELRKERLACIKKEKEIEKLKELNRICLQSQCSNCGRSTIKPGFISNMSTKDLEIMNSLNKSRSYKMDPAIVRRYTLGEININPMGKSLSSKVDSKQSRKSSLSLNNLNKIVDQEEMGKSEDMHSYIEDAVNREIEFYRDYNMSTDNLSNIPRYKISRANTDDMDIEGLIENSWLEPPSKLEERRASVFVQIDADFEQAKDSDRRLSLNNKQPEIFDLIPSRTRSSSYSSSNDTSDNNSVDSREERKKLEQQLLNQTNRHHSRSPATTLLNSSLVSEDLKSLTPTIHDIDQVHILDDHAQFIESFTLSENNNSSGNSSNQKSGHQSPNSLNEDKSVELPQRKESFIMPFMNGVPFESVEIKSDVPIIIEPPMLEPAVNVSQEANSETSGPTDSIDKVQNSKVNQLYDGENNNDSDPATLVQVTLNKSNISSCSSSVAGDDTRTTRSNTKARLKRLNRPHTIAGIGINVFKSIQDDNISINDEPSLYGDASDIQEYIDMLNDTSRALKLLSPEELETKFSETILMYRTDRPTVIDRATDANNKCNKALTNVEQEFNILRHLIKNLAMVVDHPCDLISRIKTSVNVLEKCMEYLSAKSEILGSVQQELKLSCLTDVMQEFTVLLQKQKENHLRELEELKNSLSMWNDIGITSSIDQTRSKRSMLAGKDPKTRFQMVAQSTATKTSVLRQLTNSISKGNLSASPDITTADNVKYDPKLQSSRSSSNQSIAFGDATRKSSNDENVKSRKVAVSKFFPSTPSADDCSENLYQKGLAQGLRMSTDQTLTDLRAQQSKFSSTLDALSDMIEECESCDGIDMDCSRNQYTKTFLIKERFFSLFRGFKTFISRMFYVAVGLIFMIGLLIPWFFIPANPDTPSFSVPVMSRRRSYSFPDRSEPSDQSDPSGSSSLFLSNINVVRHKPAAV